MNRQLFEYSYALRKERKQKSFFLIIYILLIIVFINLILNFLIFPVRQFSNSMNPDIQEQSYVFVTPIAKKYTRGDIVLISSRTENEYNKRQMFFYNLIAFFTGQQIRLYENKDFPGTKPQLRRIIAEPGDTIYMRDYVLYIKQQGEKHFLTEFEVIDKEYNVTFVVAPADWDSSIGVKGSFEEIILGNNEYFVLGDNRQTSFDSRLWGPVKFDDIKGKALLCYFPFNKIKLY